MSEIMPFLGIIRFYVRIMENYSLFCLDSWQHGSWASDFIHKSILWQRNTFHDICKASLEIDPVSGRLLTTLTKKHLCLQGDSGGGLVSLDSDHLELIGVMSAGIGCGRHHLPGLYTRVERFIPWIVENIKE